MNNLFERANSVGLGYIREWLPDGRQEGAEWICYSLEREEKTPSFKINLNTGKFADFGDSSVTGNDAVALYAYLNRQNLELAAKNYKNFEGGLQAEAAKAILENHDSSYFPDPNDDFTAPKVKGDYWSGFRCITRGLENAPNPLEAIKFHEKYFGEYKTHWIFTDKKGFPLFLVARFFKDKKSDRPFSLWTNGTETKWRSKNMEGILPLYNLPSFDQFQNLPILLVEGQKCAEAGKIIPGYISTAVYRAFDKTDLEPMRGRTVYYWFDPDTSGRAKLKKFQEIAKEMDIIVHPVHSPTGKPPGWDVSDAIGESWGIDKILEHIEGRSMEETAFIDSGFPFRIIGTTANSVYFYTKETTQLMNYKKSSLNKGALMTLMPKQDWGASFQKPDGGTAWDSAIDWVLREAATAPIYNNSMIRGAGAFIDNGKIVINNGNKIIIDKKEESLYDFNSKYTYEKKPVLPYTYKNPMNDTDSTELYDIIMSLDWVKPEHGAFVAGWLFLAPFSGALKWRPHIWISGTQGSGKSWILDNIVFPLLKSFNIPALGTSTIAGPRQAQGNSSLCMTIDEAESDTKNKAENVEGFLTIARQASSGVEGGSAILHGNQEGTGTEWRMQNMFMFASIGAVLKHGADKRRFNICLLKNPKRSKIEDRKNKFDNLEKKVEMITHVWSEAFYSRALNNMNETLKAIKIFKSQVSIILKSIPAGDQTGTLLAGAYMCTHDVAPLASECKIWLEQWNLTADANDSASAEEECIIEILSYKLEVSHEKYTIGSLIRYWFSEKGFIGRDSNDYQYSMNEDKVKLALETVGIKPISRDGIYVLVAAKNRELRLILKDTPWKDNYIDILGRLHYCEGGIVTGGKFAGVGRVSYIKLKADDVLDDVPF